MILIWEEANKGTKIFLYINTSIYTRMDVWCIIKKALQIRGEKIDYSIKGARKMIINMR